MISDREEGKERTEARCYTADFEDGISQELSSRIWKRQENRFSPRASGRSAALMATCLQPGETDFRLLNVCSFKPPNLWHFVAAAIRNKYIHVNIVLY